MEARATAKTIRVSPQKARLVVDLVRGKSVKEALGILEFTNKSATPAIIKVVNSAKANAVNNEGADEDKLYIKKIYVDEGPTLKRFDARAKGSGTQILKRTCHITCVVEER
ncbi:50S ribosomal protein L22 [Catenibacterium mitsuokai]|uniref:50S ribosomal protein L22 n=1 Tax=Catenibacterium mitsuokai TaxID=100886 RepID=UPI003F8C1122